MNPVQVSVPYIQCLDSISSSLRTEFLRGYRFRFLYNGVGCVVKENIELWVLASVCCN